MQYYDFSKGGEAWQAERVRMETAVAIPGQLLLL
jgi:hypothetical protein